MIEESIPVRISPKCHSERCPVCNGHGSLNYGKKGCHGCRGQGFILVPNELPTNEEGEKYAGSSYCNGNK